MEENSQLFRGDVRLYLPQLRLMPGNLLKPLVDPAGRYAGMIKPVSLLLYWDYL
jgi:hypothetical protein